MARRAALKGAAAIGAAVATSSFLPAVAAAAAPAKPGKPPTSANGWPIESRANHVSTVWTRPVAGTGLGVDVRIGDVELILVHVIRRFHYEIERIQRIDLAGWQAIGTLSRRLPESNLASGTAVRLRPGAAAKGGLFPLQEEVLRDILADCGGVVRWGGDDIEVDESLFYLDAGPDDSRVSGTAEVLRRWQATPGAGAGAEVDIRSAARRGRADRLARVQRSA
nr:hypothetical protein [Streptomyces sp. SID3212]